ncbi:MAG TPA: glycosyltransferase [Blastocatellia bacterium]
MSARAEHLHCAAEQVESNARVAVVTNLLSHYRVPCFQELAGRMPGRVTFFTLADKMTHRNYVLANNSREIPVRSLKGWSWSHPPYDDRHMNDIRPILGGNYNTIILGAWDEPTYLLLWAWGVATGKKIIFWIESTAYESRRSGIAAGIKERYKRALIRRSAGCVVPGRRAFDYCNQLGMPECRIFVAPNAVDRDYFSSQASRLVEQRETLRLRLGLSGTVVLFVGRFVESYKDVMTLVRSVSGIQHSGSPVNLVLVGDGPDRSTYQAWINEHNCANVHFAGELDHGRLCEYYAAADVLVLPSKSETWGFVLNEAMEFGLPVIVSEAVGAGPDLVYDGQNGFVIPVGDHERLAEALISLGQDGNLRRQMGRNSREIIARFSPETWASGVCEAIKAVGPATRAVAR